MLSSETWQASPNVVSAKLGDELALLDMTSNTYFTANQTTNHIWALLGQPQNFDAIVSSVAASFDVSEAECRDDVSELLALLADKGLILPADENGEAQHERHG